MDILSLHESNFKIKKKRKGNMRRKLAKDAYKKISTYIDVNKNSVIKAIENLLHSEDKDSMSASDIEAAMQTLQMENEVASARRFEPNEYDPFSNDRFNISSNSENEIIEPFEFKELNVEIPDRFMRRFDRQVMNETVLRKALGNKSYKRVYERAISTYTFQMKMVQEGHRMQSKYSIFV